MAGGYVEIPPMVVSTSAEVAVREDPWSREEEWDWLHHCATTWELARMRSAARAEVDHQKLINEGFGIHE